MYSDRDPNLFWQYDCGGGIPRAYIRLPLALSISAQAAARIAHVWQKESLAGVSPVSPEVCNGKDTPCAPSIALLKTQSLECWFRIILLSLTCAWYKDLVRLQYSWEADKDQRHICGALHLYQQTQWWPASKQPSLADVPPQGKWKANFHEAERPSISHHKGLGTWKKVLQLINDACWNVGEGIGRGVHCPWDRGCLLYWVCRHGGQLSDKKQCKAWPELYLLARSHERHTFQRFLYD